MRVARSADLGALVAEKRERLGLSQQQLAEESGVTRDWLNRFERGKSTVTLHRVLWVLNALGLEMSVSDGR
ncbi:MAG: transcriptional regulator [Microbacterium sp.]|nr:MAG: transcriptional regulator [Microbacterium sp.]